MALHVLVENEAAYRTARQTLGRDSGQPTRWYTTSPWLLERLSHERVPASSLEEDISQETMNQVGEVSLVISRRLSQTLNGACTQWPAGVSVGNLLLSHCHRLFSTLVYKALLLNRWVGRLEQDAGRLAYVFGSIRVTPVVGFDVPIARFDTLFAALAAEAGMPEWLEVREVSQKDARISYVTERIPLWDRWFSLLGGDASVLVYRVWYYVFRGARFRLSWRAPTNRVWVYKDNQLLRETFLSLLRLGCQVEKLPKFRSPQTVPPLKLSVNRQEDWVASVTAWITEWVEESPLGEALPGYLVSRVAVLAAERIGQALQAGHRLAWGLEEAVTHHPAFTDGLRSMSRVVVTNGLTSPSDRLLHQLLNRRGIPVIEFEHGVSVGLSIHHRPLHGVLSTADCEGLIAYNEASRAFFEREPACPGRSVIAGAPLQERGVPLKRLQRALGRRLLQIAPGRRVILYVTGDYQNNLVFLPHRPSDYQYHLLRTRLIVELFPTLDAECVVKLYPTGRYPDPDPFMGAVPLAKNIKIVHLSDFRYWRAIADVLIVDFPYSTLGWAWAVDVPLIYLDMPAQSLLPEIARQFDEAIFRVDCGRTGWHEELAGLLRLPPDTLHRRWMAKATARELVSRACVLGPGGHPGSRAAEGIRRLVLALTGRPFRPGDETAQQDGPSVEPAAATPASFPNG